MRRLTAEEVDLVGLAEAPLSKKAAVVAMERDLAVEYCSLDAALRQLECSNISLFATAPASRSVEPASLPLLVLVPSLILL